MRTDHKPNNTPHFSIQLVLADDLNTLNYSGKLQYEFNSIRPL